MYEVEIVLYNDDGSFFSTWPMLVVSTVPETVAVPYLADDGRPCGRYFNFVGKHKGEYQDESVFVYQ